MPVQDSPADLQISLKKIIDKMQALQKKIGSSSQPASGHELGMLIILGEQYADVVEKLQNTKKAG